MKGRERDRKVDLVLLLFGLDYRSIHVRYTSNKKYITEV